MYDWMKILEQEDRIINNSDRRYRRHCSSLEGMSEEYTYRLSMERYVADELGRSRDSFDFVDTG